MYTIAVGNPWDGIYLEGLFSNADDADKYAFEHLHDLEYWILTIG